MSDSFNLAELAKNSISNNRYERRMAKLVGVGKEVDKIKSAVENTIKNLESNHNSFVIYGEPQSGKTEMMIALTARLLDLGYNIVIILMNDSVQLLEQNLERFQRSGLSPSPKRFNEILHPDIKIGQHQWIIFCKKNSSDLQKLLNKLDRTDRRIVIDDEADYATPNSKINKQEKTRINKLTEDLIGKNGIYIGVTATPARLDLNRTHDNLNEFWVDFPAHSSYTGQDVFFPNNIENLPFFLNLLPDEGDSPRYLRGALFSFLVKVAYLNIYINDPEKNYSMLVHTSGKKADHAIDYQQILKIFEILKDSNNKDYKSYFKQIWDRASELYTTDADKIVTYIMENCERNNIVVMNSDKEVRAADNRTATDPTSPFTIVIGGNIVSRGVTFENLLSMFFTRDVKHKLQQDTYIQRARMFGSRGQYLKYFELHIQKSLYLDWQKCFIFHRLSLASRKQNQRSPVWLDGERITAVASGSIDKTNVLMDKGEMSFDLFDYDSLEKDVLDILKASSKPLYKLQALHELIGEGCLPKYLISYIENFCPLGDKSIAVHSPKNIGRYVDKKGETDTTSITRTRGFIGKREREVTKFPNAIHHINLLFNANGKARIFYKYEGNVKFLKTRKSDKKI